MQAVVRALSILKALATAPGGMTQGELAQELSLPVASAHRLVSVLEAEQFVTRSPTNRRYFLGPSARQIGRSVEPRQSLLIPPHEALRVAGRATGETVFLCELVGGRVVCLALVESRHPLRLFVRVGQEMPLHAASSARVLLAWRDPQTARHLLAKSELIPFTSDTPLDAEKVMNRLELVRQRGFDVCDSELNENTWAVALPVRSATGEVVASVTMAGPQHRFESESKRAEAIAHLREAAAKLGADLGWVDPAAG